MKPTVFTPPAAMWSAMPDAISASFCAVLKTHLRFSSMGLIRRAEAAMVTIGVFVSAATSIIAIDTGVVEEPITASTFSSEISLRALATPFVVSEPSSSTT